MITEAKRLIPIVLVLAAAFAFSCAARAGVTLVDLPESGSETELLWQKKFSDTFFKAPSVPAIRGDSLFIMTGNELSRLDRFTGEVTGTAALRSRCVFSTVSVVFCGNTAICPMVDGIVQAFDADTLGEKWTYTDPLGGQCLTQPVIESGLIFTGFWYGETDDAAFVCLDAGTGEAVWRYVRPGGFYGTVACIVDDCVIIGSEDAAVGSDGGSELICLDALTGKVLSTLPVTGEIRSGVAYDDISGRMFAVSKAAYLYSFSLDNGKLTDLETLKLSGASTSRPVVYNGRLYIGVSGGCRDSGGIAVIDAGNLSVIYTMKTPGYCQTELTVKPRFDDYKTVTVYGTYNYPPGGIIAFTDGEGVTSAEAREIFSPAASAYCLSPIVAADTGELYYKNDTCTVFALKKTNAGVNPVLSKLFSLITSVISVFANAGFFG
ncbi:MAG: PQQ-binding-like beta-propeller repeat protein [Clostridia bacterium]|nr:PQQ-binding-like beta-propeller repeat protein [Clostridia bacterium]